MLCCTGIIISTTTFVGCALILGAWGGVDSVDTELPPLILHEYLFMNNTS